LEKEEKEKERLLRLEKKREEEEKERKEKEKLKEFQEAQERTRLELLAEKKEKERLEEEKEKQRKEEERQARAKAFQEKAQREAEEAEIARKKRMELEQQQKEEAEKERIKREEEKTRRKKEKEEIAIIQKVRLERMALQEKLKDQERLQKLKEEKESERIAKEKEQALERQKKEEEREKREREKQMKKKYLELEQQVQSCLSAHICTFTATRKELHSQFAYFCGSCDFDVCEICLFSCHISHNTFVLTSDIAAQDKHQLKRGFTCECGRRGKCTALGHAEVEVDSSSHEHNLEHSRENLIPKLPSLRSGVGSKRVDTLRLSPRKSSSDVPLISPKSKEKLDEKDPSTVSINSNSPVQSPRIELTSTENSTVKPIESTEQPVVQSAGVQLVPVEPESNRRSSLLLGNGRLKKSKSQETVSSVLNPQVQQEKIRLENEKKDAKLENERKSEKSEKTEKN